MAGTGVMGFADSFCEQTIFDRPKAVCCTPDGLIYVADSDNFRIRCIDRKSNTVRTLAGSYKKGHKDAVANEAAFYFPHSLVHHEGKLYVSDSANDCIRRVIIRTGEPFSLRIGVEAL